MYTRICGTPKEVMSRHPKRVLVGDKNDPFDKTIEQIFKDLDRTKIISTEGKTYHDLIQAWMGYDEALFYIQGIADGRLQSLWLCDHYSGKTREDCSFAYFKNGIPCSFSISWLKEDPSIWTQATIHNTLSSQSIIRQVIPQSFVVSDPSETVHSNVEQLILDSIECEELQEMLRGFLDSGNRINVEKLKQLQAQAIVNIEDKTSYDMKKTRYEFIKHYVAEKFIVRDNPSCEDSITSYHLLNKEKQRMGASFCGIIKQSFFRRNRASLGLGFAGVLFILGVSIYVSPPFFLALIVLGVPIVSISQGEKKLKDYKEIVQKTENAHRVLLEQCYYSLVSKKIEQHIVFFKTVCRPLLLQTANTMTEDQVKLHIDKAFNSEFPLTHPMTLLMTPTEDHALKNTPHPRAAANVVKQLDSSPREPTPASLKPF